MSERISESVSLREAGAVGLITFERPPHNYFDTKLLCDIADALELVDSHPHLRSSVLSSTGKCFCAGADFAGDRVAIEGVYQQGLRIFAAVKPIVAAIQGPAIGGGMGLALTADFRVVSTQARFAANFVKIGIHPGFGMTYVLPRLIGDQRAALLMLTGRRIVGEEAVAMGLADVLAPEDELLAQAMGLAAELAEGAPLAVQATRATLRSDLVTKLRSQLDHEIGEQLRLFESEDFAEGIRAVSERRNGQWKAA